MEKKLYSKTDDVYRFFPLYIRVSFYFRLFIISSSKYRNCYRS